MQRFKRSGHMGEKMKYILIGRIGSRIEKLAEELERTGMLVAKKPYEMCCLHTSDAVLADLSEVVNIAGKYPDTSFHIIYAKAKPSKRKIQALQDGIDRKTFIKTNSIEEEYFSEFEKYLYKPLRPMAANIKVIHSIEIEEDGYDETVQSLISYLHVFNNCKHIVEKCIESGAIMSCVLGSIVVYTEDGKKEMSTECFVDEVLGNEKGFVRLMNSYMSSYKISQERRWKNKMVSKECERQIGGQISLF